MANDDFLGRQRSVCSKVPHWLKPKSLLIRYEVFMAGVPGIVLPRLGTRLDISRYKLSFLWIMYHYMTSCLLCPQSHYA
jgi:hypothetical protein